MPGRGKTGKVKGTPKSRSKRSGIQFPVARVHRYLRKGDFAKRISSGAAVYMAAVLEYLSAEMLELAGDAARDGQKKRIIPRHIQLAIRNDEELNRLLVSVTIAQGGVCPTSRQCCWPRIGEESTVNDGRPLQKQTALLGATRAIKEMTSQITSHDVQLSTHSKEITFCLTTNYGIIKF